MVHLLHGMPTLSTNQLGHMLIVPLAFECYDDLMCPCATLQIDRICHGVHHLDAFAVFILYKVLHQRVALNSARPFAFQMLQSQKISFAGG